MAYTGITIETAVNSTTLSSHCIPAYPEYSSNTTYNAAFYTSRQSSNDALAGEAITEYVPS
tara:strand:+ start:562 stop:744 length:183 start_codon:yes stop_codon:yes gene_type:complete